MPDIARSGDEIKEMRLKKMNDCKKEAMVIYNKVSKKDYPGALNLLQMTFGTRGKRVWVLPVGGVLIREALSFIPHDNKVKLFGLRDSLIDELKKNTPNHQEALKYAEGMTAEIDEIITGINKDILGDLKFRNSILNRG